MDDAWGGITMGPDRATRPLSPVAVSSAESRPLSDLLSAFRTFGAERAFRGFAFPVLVPRATNLDGTLTSVAHSLPSLHGTTGPGWSRLADEIARIFIGRSPKNAIVVEDMTVSNRHASIVRHLGGRWSVVDEGSRNGTFLDGERLRPAAPVALPRGLATIRLGPDAGLLLMEESVFTDYLRALANVVEERDVRPFGQTRRRSRLPAELIRQTVPGVAHQSPLAAAILRATREAPPFPARRYQVALEDALVEDFEAWPALVEFIERNADRIVTVEASWGAGRELVVYHRAERTPRVNRG